MKRCTGMGWDVINVVVPCGFTTTYYEVLLSTKVTKAEHPRAHFSNMILSQSNGVVLNSVHELCSCNANCISGGSYFRITIALNYST